jgi:hypothetical protein
MNWLRSRALHLAAVVLLFGVVAWVATVTDPQIARVPPPSFELAEVPDGAARPTELTSPRPRVAPDTRGGGILRVLALVATAVLLVGLLAVLLALVWQAVRDQVTVRRTGSREATQRHATPDAEPVRAAVAAGLEDLALDGADPRSVVIACWLRLERAAASAGTPREPSDTPADLVARMLAQHRVSGPVLDRLAEVYRRARYAPAEVGEAMREEASAALRLLHAELTGQVPVAAGGEVTDEPG